jgi:hypothetical protein
VRRQVGAAIQPCLEPDFRERKQPATRRHRQAIASGNLPNALGIALVARDFEHVKDVGCNEPDRIVGEQDANLPAVELVVIALPFTPRALGLPVHPDPETAIERPQQPQRPERRRQHEREAEGARFRVDEHQRPADDAP